MLGSLRLDFSSTVLLLKKPLPRLILNSLRIQNVEIGIPKNFCTDSTSTANAASSGRLAASAALVTMMPATVEPATGGAAINAYSLPNSREPTVKQISAIAAMANSEITTVFHSRIRSSRLISVPILVIMNAVPKFAITATRPDWVVMSLGSRPLQNPMRNDTQANNSDETAPLVFLDKNSPTE